MLSNYFALKVDARRFCSTSALCRRWRRSGTLTPNITTTSGGGGEPRLAGVLRLYNYYTHIGIVNVQCRCDDITVAAESSHTTLDNNN